MKTNKAKDQERNHFLTQNSFTCTRKQLVTHIQEYPGHLFISMSLTMTLLSLQFHFIPLLLPIGHGAPITMDFFLLLQHTSLTLCPGPLHSLFPYMEHYLCRSPHRLPSHHSSLRSNAHFSENLSLTPSLTPPPPPATILFCFLTGTYNYIKLSMFTF